MAKFSFPSMFVSRSGSLWDKIGGLTLVSLAALSACGPAPQSSAVQSKIDSVEIPQTPVENQNRIGFCWAYSVVGLIESDYKFRTGENLQLSEEALGFYRMLEGLYFLTQNLSGQDLINNINQDSLQGWVLTDEQLPDTFDLVEKFGVIPESVWSVKFTDAQRVDRMVRTIQKAMNKLVFNTSNPKSITREQIKNEALLIAGAWESAPPDSFEVNGTAYTPKSYLDSLNFKPTNYVSVISSRPEDIDKIISVTKKALVRGISVPLGFPINFSRLKADTFSGEGVDLNNPNNFFREGGHAVLVEDFVNEGGKLGALPIAELLTEFLRPAKDLDFLMVKNSWGTDAETNEAGVVISGSKTGYYKIDREYLEGSANMSRNPEYRGMLEVVVPIDIAQDPYGEPEISPSVVLPE